MSELDELYQGIILDHSRTPRHHGVLEPFDRKAEGYNPLCGDDVQVYLRLEGDTVADLRFSGQGCALSRASASLMCEHLKGFTLAAAQREIERIIVLLSEANSGLDITGLGDLVALTGVHKFPARIKCVTLCWHALDDALAVKPDSS